MQEKVVSPQPLLPFSQMPLLTKEIDDDSLIKFLLSQKHLKFDAEKVKEMETSQNSKKIFLAMFKSMCGITFEAMKKKVKQTHLKIIQDFLKIKQERLEIKQERLETEQDCLKIQREIEEFQTHLILILYVQNHFSVEKIVADYKFDLEFVKETLKKYLDEQDELSQNIEGLKSL